MTRREPSTTAPVSESTCGGPDVVDADFCHVREDLLRAELVPCGEAPRDVEFQVSRLRMESGTGRIDRGCWAFEISGRRRSELTDRQQSDLGHVLHGETDAFATQAAAVFPPSPPMR